MQVKFYDSKDFPPYLPKLNAIYDDLFGGGKFFRARLVRLICREINLGERQTDLLSQTIEFIHQASLLHDDLVDRSQLRRGKTTAWLKFTPEYAVLSGDYLLARVMVNLSQNGNIKLVQLTAQAISDLLEGEWLQDSLVKDFSLELSQLDRVHDLKTASLFKWCLKAPFVAQGTVGNDVIASLDELGTLLGILFQRGDDLLDFDIRNQERKAILGDLKSGYVNSFAAFAFSQDQRAPLSRCQSLGEFKNLLGGDGAFEKKVMEFDHLNENMETLYKHKVDQLREKFNFPILLDRLKQLTEILYWRQVPEEWS
jgi:octaprenyl-diphosphate synthase